MTKKALLLFLLFFPALVLSAQIRNITTISHKYIEYNKSTNTRNIALDEAIAIKIQPNLTLLGKAYGMYNPTWQMIKAGLGAVYVWGGGFYSEISYSANTTLKHDDSTTPDINESAPPSLAHNVYFDLSYENAFLYANGSIQSTISPGETILFASPGIKYFILPHFTIWNKFTVVQTINIYKENPPSSYSYWGELEFWPLEILGFRLGGTAAITNTLLTDNSINSVIDLGILGGINYKLTSQLLLKYQGSLGRKMLPNNKITAYYHIENLITLDFRF